MDNKLLRKVENKKIIVLIMLIIFFMLCTIGATFAYFTATATNNIINGNFATTDLYWGSNDTNGLPSLVSPSGSYASVDLVPQKSLNGSTNVLQLAVNGTQPSGASSNVPCVDSNGNAVCKIYTFTICNDSTATVVLNGTIKFTWGTDSTFSNLKWKLMDSATSTGTVSSDTIKSATTSEQNFITNVSLAPDTATADGVCNGGSKTYHIVIWLEEANVDQKNIDKGTFYATISFDSSNGTGVTATFSGSSSYLGG